METETFPHRVEWCSWTPEETGESTAVPALLERARQQIDQLTERIRELEESKVDKQTALELSRRVPLTAQALEERLEAAREAVRDQTRETVARYAEEARVGREASGDVRTLQRRVTELERELKTAQQALAAPEAEWERRRARLLDLHAQDLAYIQRGTELAKLEHLKALDELRASHAKAAIATDATIQRLRQSLSTVREVVAQEEREKLCAQVTRYLSDAHVDGSED